MLLAACLAGCASKPAHQAVEVKVTTIVLDERVDEAAKSITRDDLKAWASYLASDELEGRNAGYPGNDKAVEYIASIYKEAGLKPAGENGTYFYTVKVTRGHKEYVSRNTVALLEGTDLKDEIVVVGGHHDHVGREGQLDQGRIGRAGAKDDIWNGADDNASGTSVVMALAKAFGKSGLKPKRSILFMTFTFEEWGLIGSERYCAKPLFPIEKHVAMLNLDMVGRNPDKPVKVYGAGYEDGDVWEKLADAACAKTGLKYVQHSTEGFLGGRSDQGSFRDKGIPVMFFFTGFHDDYHQHTDHADKLAYENMEKIGRTAMHILWEWANGTRPKFTDPERGK
jgi:Zn-dependent M28 family amino/carboxypeptidase